MIEIFHHRNFKKDYKKLEVNQKECVNEALRLFKKDPFDSKLYNHKLKGKMRGNRAIHAGFNLCIVFEIKGDYEQVVLIKVGTHDDVYK